MEFERRRAWHQGTGNRALGHPLSRVRVHATLTYQNFKVFGGSQPGLDSNIKLIPVQVALAVVNGEQN